MDTLTGDVDELLGYLREARGFDFGGYKRTSLLRRIGHRLQQLGITDYAEYIDRLQVDTSEFTSLFNTILINVTSFFRDQEAWELLRGTVCPALIAERAAGASIRIWSAGCSSGQEAYSLAMILAEQLGPDRYLETVKIYATDIDEEALSQARQASYDESEMEGVPRDLRNKYFERRDRRHVFRQDLRRTVIFGRNDLVQDAPISRIDLLTCRNTLMYFNAETQTRVLGRFHFALVPRGILFLGKAEMLLSHGHIFEPVDLKRRVFRRLANTVVTAPPVQQRSGPDRTYDVGGVDRLRHHAFNAAPVAQLCVTPDGALALLNQQAAVTFGLSARDIGRPLRELEISYRPIELRSHLKHVALDRKPIRTTDVEWRRPGGVTQWFEVLVNPLLDESDLLGISIVFHDMTAARSLQHELLLANRQLETTNEELQSTNEELETTNDELQVINETLRERSSELNDVNDFLGSILTGIKAGVVVVDGEMRVLAWNAGSQDLWGVRPDEAQGQHLLNLDVGLPMADLQPVVRDALADPEFVKEIRLSAVNRRGRNIDVRLICSALRSTGGDVRGALLVMESST